MTTMFEDDREKSCCHHARLKSDTDDKLHAVAVTTVTVSDDGTEAKAEQLTPTPLDSGRAAYTVLLACFLLQTAIAGFPLAFGIFEDYYSTRYDNFETASWIGVLSEGLPYLGAPLMTICCQKFRLPLQVYIITGVSVCAASHLASAFVTNLPILIVTQGCLFGLGSLLTDIPSLVILDTHFSKRRGLAYGVVFGGADLAGIGYAFLATYLFEKYTYRITMIVFAGLTFVLGAMAAYFLRERKAICLESVVSMTIDDGDTFIPKPLTRARPLVPPEAIRSGIFFRRTSVSTWQEPQQRYYQRLVFYILNASNVILAMAAALPWIYLPTFATGLGFSRNAGALILALGMLFQFLGEITFGLLSDKINVKFLVIVTMSVSALSTFLLWGVLGSTGLAALLVYACLFGCFSAGYLALWTRMGTLFGKDDSIMVYSILNTGKGAGVILSGPISQCLLTSPSSIRLGGMSSARWGAIIAYVGSCTSVSALLGGFAFIAGTR